MPRGRQRGVALERFSLAAVRLRWIRTSLSALVAAGLVLAPLHAAAQAAGSRYLAPGFTELSKAARVVLMPIDVELFSLSAGGVAEPRADWTEAALRHMNGAMTAKTSALGLNATLMSEQAADEFAEQVGLHAAVARSIALHHGMGGVWRLPTKEDRLDWSFDDSMKPLHEKTGARYALFVWVRDSYASAERKAAMVAMAVIGAAFGAGIILAGGSQTGYASLVDLETGRVVWFNRLARDKGDMREPAAAAESIEALLTGFPAVR